MPVELKSAEGRPAGADEQVRAVVSEILLAIESEGEAAVRRYSERFDGWAPPSFRVDEEVKRAAVERVDPELRSQIDFARKQVTAFAEAQRACITDLSVQPLPGVELGHRNVPVGSVGSYSPGGRYPLIASSLMTIVTPKVAGVKRVAACAPPRRDGGGIHEAQLYAMVSSGADQVLCIGGVQGMAAMAFGIEGIEPVDMIVGAGNAYVAEAKRQLFGRVGIDLLAGPTEILVLADDSADPELVAADLLGQAEHGPTSPAILVTDSEQFGAAVIRSVERWLERWPTAEVASEAWRKCGRVLLCESREEMVRVSDEIATEHLELQTGDDDWFVQRLTNYGTVFIGPLSTVAYSDKAIGTNHVLPTERAARYTGGLWVGKFLKTLTYQRVSAAGTAEIAPATVAICEAEGMLGHAITAQVRLDQAT
jgi:sulfopropanediol 3-dehydrogenase